MKQFILSESAQRDLRAIWAYSIKNWSQKQTDKYIRSLTSSCEALAKNRRIGLMAYDIRSDLMKLYSGSHTIYYSRDENGTVYVYRFLHQSQDTGNL